MGASGVVRPGTEGPPCTLFAFGGISVGPQAVVNRFLRFV